MYTGERRKKLITYVLHLHSRVGLCSIAAIWGSPVLLRELLAHVLVRVLKLDSDSMVFVVCHWFPLWGENTFVHVSLIKLKQHLVLLLAAGKVTT